MRFKLITYNIWHGRYLDRVIDFLRKEHADMVCLQEVSRSGRNFKSAPVQIFQQIQKALNGDAVYAGMFGGIDSGGSWDVGVALLSTTKLNLVRRTHYFEPYAHYSERDDWSFSWPPVMLVATSHWNGVGITVVTTHAPVTYQASVTLRQLAAARAFKSALPNEDELIFCGDLNTHFDTETYRIYKEDFEDVSGTLPTLHSKLHPAGSKGYHVDYVFYRGEAIQLLATRIPVVDGSDHLPVVCEFEVGV